MRAIPLPGPCRARQGGGWRVALIAVLAALVAAAGCTAEVRVDADAAAPEEPAEPSSATDDSGADDPGRADDPGAGPDQPDAPAGGAIDLDALTAGLATTECGFEVPNGADIECGTVVVPEDYTDPDGSTVELAVAHLQSEAADPTATPVIYLEGGPGGHALETLPYVYADRYAPLLETRDVIVFDQRGAGFSRPRLACPGVDELDDALAQEPDLTVDEERDRLLEALGECRDDLTAAGHDLTQYHTENSARDVVLVARALDAEQLHLFGISYGTRLALAVIRLHPEIVGSAVLDSTLAPHVDATAATQASLVRSYEQVIAACEADSACSEEFPDLDQRFRALYEQLEREPLLAEATDFLDGSTTEGYLDGDALVGLVFSALYDPYTFGDLPELVADLEAGSVEVAEGFLSLEATNASFFTVGMFYSFACHDEVAFSSPEAVAAAAPDDPLFADALALSGNVGSLAFPLCEVWQAGAAPAADDELVTGSVPVLFLAGDFDPVTPPEWAEEAAVALDDARVVRFPSLSHGVTSDPCGTQLTVDFFDDPTTLDVSCVDELEPPEFVAGASTAAIELVEYEAEVDVFDVRVASVRPTEWTLDVSGTQASRARSVTDETALIQIGIEETFAATLAELVASQLDVELGTSEDVDVGGRSWSHRSGVSDDGVAVDVWIEPAGDTRAAVILVSHEVDRDRLVSEVADAALAAIEVSPR